MRDADAVASMKGATKLKARTRKNTNRSTVAMQKSYGNACKGNDLMLEQSIRNKPKDDYK